jgi:hypothetical protein
MFEKQKQRKKSTEPAKHEKKRRKGKQERNRKN